MGSRDPSGGSLLTSGEYDVTLGGPLGVIMGLVLFAAVAVVMVVVVTTLEAILTPVLPVWLVWPALLVVATGLVGAGLFGLLRFNEWRRYR